MSARPLLLAALVGSALCLVGASGAAGAEQETPPPPAEVVAAPAQVDQPEGGQPATEQPAAEQPATEQPAGEPPTALTTEQQVGLPPGASVPDATAATQAEASAADAAAKAAADAEAVLVVRKEKFFAFLTSFRDVALAEGIGPATYDRAISGLMPDLRVDELNAAQPEFVRPVWEYLAGTVSDQRVSQGLDKLAEYRDVFNRVEETYGVPRQVVAAIWGLETGYGRNTGRFNLFQALATLAYDGARQNFGRRQFIAALKIAEAEKLDPQAMEGSWAGAFGHTQFVPTTFLEHAVDGNGDGKRDLWNEPADALASAASYLMRSGWRADQEWGEEVILPADFPFDQADDANRKPEREWNALGVRNMAGQYLADSDTPSSIFLPSGARGPAFLLRGNFNAVLRYNNATSYALAISLLADRMRGRPGVTGSWPIDERPLGRDERRSLQQGLSDLGFDVGGVDGVIGRQTRNALRAYQKSRGLAADGFATASLLERIRSEIPQP